MPPRKIPLHATVEETVMDDIDDFVEETPRGTSKSQVIEDLLKHGLKHKQEILDAYKKAQKQK